MTDGQLDPKTGDGESGLEDQKTGNLIPFLFFGMYARSSQVKTCFKRIRMAGWQILGLQPQKKEPASIRNQEWFLTYP